ncbi:hypothetical protein PTT_07380 [Pyrenophora teres f. teres 0-1]|uniref:Uncharacterized protein n=1 Tax=Pyrenophora teres f. teres (strain 0-1) TaxID=861557 RepID=E3RHH9_PYRTT|nr:hypothetical protein PTT_07380 [Pyrenophora teres f. teres 0-1]KAE8836432.1 hypothetical protein HRS9139_04530 [Pyrenophora teres f. teres]KAE8837596.1 hypothetical protein PTNB85_04931 [Pyrenophora teres f. teres]KAE8839984.1 hypothetical protein HRS9122_06589 [Pyrenophora teres f. teres]
MPPRRRPRHAAFNPTSMGSPSPSTSPPPRVRRIPRATTAFNTSTATPFLAPPAPEATEPSAESHLPAHYWLPPTFPSPFAGTLDAALDAILEYGQRYGHIKGVQPIVSALLSQVNPKTAWRELLQAPADKPPGMLRFLWTSLLFLTSRTLLPELIAENRALLWRVYDHKKKLASRFMLRYDMLCAWKMEVRQSTNRLRDVAVTFAGVEPEEWGVIPTVEGRYEEKEKVEEDENGIRVLMPNIIPTLIAATRPKGGSTQTVRERMRHHVTDLDRYLLLTDEEVETWRAERLLQMTCTLILHWQWLRRSNETLRDMEVGAWEDLDAKADECEWIADDAKRVVGWHQGGKIVQEKEKEKEGI